MNTNIRKMGAVLLAVGLCAWSTQTFAQTTQTATTLTTTKGAFTEYVPGSETVVVRSEANPTPLRYVVTKQTTVVDETGTPVTLERIPAGSPLSVQYTGAGDRLVASRIIVNNAVTAPVATQETTTSTATTRPLSREERHQLKEAEQKRRHELKEQREHPERALEKPTDEDH
jgi:hypothetical protein